MYPLLSWLPLVMTLGTWALGVDRPLSGGDTTSKCCCIGMFNRPDLGGGWGGTLKWPKMKKKKYLLEKKKHLTFLQSAITILALSSFYSVAQSHAVCLWKSKIFFFKIRRSMVGQDSTKGTYFYYIIQITGGWFHQSPYTLWLIYT